MCTYVPFCMLLWDRCSLAMSGHNLPRSQIFNPPFASQNRFFFFLNMQLWQTFPFIFSVQCASIEPSHVRFPLVYHPPLTRFPHIWALFADRLCFWCLIFALRFFPESFLFPPGWCLTFDYGVAFYGFFIPRGLSTDYPFMISAASLPLKRQPRLHSLHSISCIPVRRPVSKSFSPCNHFASHAA